MKFNYNNFDKFLINLVLGSKIINKSLYEIEKILYLKKNKEKFSKLFISSLPRSGTTILLNYIYSTGEFGSLKYKNMPFIISPNLSKLFIKKKIKKSERAHGDGIFQDLNSPESFSEVFFSTFNEKEIKSELENYISLILKSEKKNKFVNKNNNDYKRIKIINDYTSKSFFLITIRDPIQQANSLLNQHIFFSSIQQSDKFITKYMNYLGHNEFGLGHKPWFDPINFLNNEDINYWLEQWYLFYKNIYSKLKKNKNIKFILYDFLDNKEYVKKFSEELNLNNIDFNFTISKKNIQDLKLNDELFKQCETLYESIKKTALN